MKLERFEFMGGFQPVRAILQRKSSCHTLRSETFTKSFRCMDDTIFWEIFRNPSRIEN